MAVKCIGTRTTAYHREPEASAAEVSMVGVGAFEEEGEHDDEVC